MLHNPEREWFRARAVDLNRTDVERRIGVTHEPLELLSGGLMNRNVRVGDRVLRIYRDVGRDYSARIGKERSLLSRPWRSFRVPRVLQTGDDFLVLEYIEHAPLTDSHGALIGRALAEIHALSYPHTGPLDQHLAVGEAFPPDGFTAGGYGRAQLHAARSILGEQMSGRVLAFLERADLSPWRPALSHGDFKLSNLHITPANELLVLDWEFAWAGPALLDIGQLLRWQSPETFVRAFADAYGDHGGVLPTNWLREAETIDLGNLLGLLSRNLGDEAVATLCERVRRTVD